MSTIEKARSQIQAARYHNGKLRFSTETSAEYLLAGLLGAFDIQNIELGREKVARCRAEWELAGLRLENAKQELKKAETSNRGESQ